MNVETLEAAVLNFDFGVLVAVGPGLGLPKKGAERDGDKGSGLRTFKAGSERCGRAAGPDLGTEGLGGSNVMSGLAWR